MLDYRYRRGFDAVCIDGDFISLVELILRPIIGLNFCVARNSLFANFSDLSSCEE